MRKTFLAIKGFMRKLIFRAWDRKEKKMVTIHDLKWRRGFGSALIGWEPPVGKKLMQFTGLKDRKGVDIYEGDIVDVQYPKKDKVMMGKNWKYIGEVKWMNDEPSFMIKVKGKPGADSLYRANEKCEIIGNIYEDKKPLKDGD